MMYYWIHLLHVGMETIMFVDSQDEEIEPIYGSLCLPRKFKIGIAILQVMMWTYFHKI